MVKNMSKQDVVFNIINYTLLSIILFSVLYPLYFILIASISDPVHVQNGSVIFWPKGLTIDGYKRLFSYEKIWRGYGNTIVYTTLGTCINVLMTMTMAYPLSRKTFFGKKFVIVFMVITMYFNGGIIPTYLIVKKLGLVNNWLVMIIVGAISIFNVIIARTFIQSTIPEELYESAALDGSSHGQFFFKIVLPLSKSLIAVLVLFYAVGHWNDYFKGLLYLSDQSKYPLQLILKDIFINETAIIPDMSSIEDLEYRRKVVELMKYGLIIVSSVPLLVIYPFVQKYFVKGAMIGAIKG